MSSNKTIYTQEFKQTIVNLYQAGKTYNEIHKEYGVSHNALANWIKTYSEVKIDDDTVLTAKQIKELQKRNAQLEEENLILKKPLRYSRLTQAKIECSKAAVFRTLDLNSLSCSESQPQYLLQISCPQALKPRA